MSTDHTGIKLPVPRAAPPRAADATARSRAEDDAATDQARALLKAIPLGFFGSVVPAGVVAWVLRAQVPPFQLGAWFGWMVVAHAARLVIWFAARPDLELGRNGRRWLDWLRSTALILGCSWAVLPLILVPATRFDELLVAAVIAAVAGAGMAQQSADMPSALLFVLPPAIPMAVRLLASSDHALQAIGDLAVMYFLYLALAAQRIQASFLELSRLRSRAATQSVHDALTGLPNRLALNLRLQNAIARAKRYGTEVAVGYIDLDDFKQVNDKFGHDAGDALLCAVARHWQTRLRETELIARLGGDEFVMVIEDIDPARAMAQLTAVFERVHHAVADPVPIAPRQSVPIGITMGVARFPVDGTDPDMLLRQADAAMYQLKLHKATRQRWWQLGVRDAAAEPAEQPVDPYGSEAAAILTEHASLFERINAEFVEAFYRDLDADPAAHALIHELDAAQFAQLKRRQQAYLRLLVAPTVTRDALTQRARHVGMLHYLAGVSGSMLARTSVRYRALLGERVGATRFPAQRRYRLLAVIESRMQDELQAQFAAGEEVGGAYLGVFSRPRPIPGTLWPDAAQRELDLIAGLPGVVAVALTRLNRDGALVVERSACSVGADVSSALFDGVGPPDLDPTSPRGASATSAAWRTQDIERVDSWSRVPRVAPWREQGMRLGIRAHVAIPFSGQDGHVAGVLTVYGAQANQFAWPWMQQWTAGVQRRLESIWAQCSAPSGALVLSEERAHGYRERLFAGGLEMFVQPIANLRTGRITGVEALARLRMADGTVVPPSVFLPPLGDIELDRVFRIGLDQALDSLRAWDARGLAVDMSINLAPSTLLDADCAGWVDDALRRHAIAPRRLTLELLETQTFDPQAQGDAIRRLHDIGIRLAMDDLGTGYSNIERLSSFKFDAIKIDQNLIRKMYDSPLQTIMLIGTLVLLGADLGQRVVVEGIEDASMLEVAAVFGADYAQGYAIAAPMPADRLPDWLGTFEATAATGLQPLRTYAGALAYHWRFVHSSNGRHPTPSAECPLGRFLADKGYQRTEVDRWHECVHDASPEAAEASQKLVDWLAERVKASRTG